MGVKDSVEGRDRVEAREPTPSGDKVGWTPEELERLRRLKIPAPPHTPKET